MSRRFDPDEYPDFSVEENYQRHNTYYQNRMRWMFQWNQSRCVLLYADGAAPNNGQPNVRAGCGIVISPGKSISFPLERVGPTVTSNRAELRAADAALRMCDWDWEEGFDHVVIATDSTYVVNGASDWVFTWQENGWRNLKGRPVANQDLWQRLLERVEQFEDRNVDVQFWYVPRGDNWEADQAARQGANMAQNVYEFQDIGIEEAFT